MIVMIIKIFVYIVVTLLWSHTIIWMACEVKKEDSYDGMNYFELKKEYEMLVEAHRQREKKKSMKGVKR